MDLWKQIKELFTGGEDEENKGEKKTGIDKAAKEEIDEKQKTNKKERKLEQELIDRAERCLQEGSYEQAMKAWETYIEKFPAGAPAVRARKARIHIIKGEEKKAREDLLLFLEWYTGKKGIDYEGNYFSIFISALQDLGFVADSWQDRDDYLDSLTGKELTLEREMTVKRIKRGLAELQEENIWNSDLEEIKTNIGKLG